MNRFKYLIFIIILSFPLPIYAGRGCCSWHGGQYGCAKNGRVVCMDGSYSPSCTCRATTKKKKTTKRTKAKFDSLNKTARSSYSFTSSSEKKSSTKTTKKKTTTKTTKKKSKNKTTTTRITTKYNNSTKTSVKDSSSNDVSTGAIVTILSLVGGLLYLGVKSQKH